MKIFLDRTYWVTNRLGAIVCRQYFDSVEQATRPESREGHCSRKVDSRTAQAPNCLARLLDDSSAMSLYRKTIKELFGGCSYASSGPA